MLEIGKFVVSGKLEVGVTDGIDDDSVRRLVERCIALCCLL